jgi:hypothetical protein
MKLQIEQLVNKRMQKLVEQQTEATKATADAAKQLGRLLRTKRTEIKKPESASTKTNTVDFSEEIRSLMSKAESHIPEVMSLAEKTEKSGGSIQKTISEAIRVLSVDEHSTKSGDITEDIAGELSSTATENIATILEQEKSSSASRVSNVASKKDSTISGSSSSSSSEKVTSSADSFTKYAGKLSDQNVREQIVRLQHKYHMMTLKEKHLEDLFKLKLAKIDKESVGLSPESVKSRKKKLMSEFKKSKAECNLVMEGLKSEEEELLFVNSQRKKLDKEELKLLLQQTTSDVDLMLSPSPSSISEQLSIKSADFEEEVGRNRSKSSERKSKEPERKKTYAGLERRERETDQEENQPRQRSLSLVPTLKPPLSPKASLATPTTRRRRHSSAESDDSFNVSQAESAVSDLSDMEIRISALRVSFVVLIVLNEQYMTCINS